ncbi:similar to glycoside hydrolase family 61 protein [Plenodomus lingam JN3]|uniref:lytic cellulose monooxygenase (C4-dehydrogenating) n=1 Tax=Leptosphaeria maculans (strain JN3 / isolate v23.1.3 / race Av1-4-5-6-7-8) TaxID=985895 RepID=E4ZSU4_LEPMJ|nr:similar to glycoside hydrolase family 61 protein [Plenodomus lingam JN3]CBX94532.1 similar to glycoside hydrolase family 61 protein [Plenodomus lingam JN3]
MKPHHLLLSFLAATTVTAHYTFPELIVNGKKTGLWTYVRKTANYQSNGPITDISSPSIRCYELSPGTPSKTYNVSAGDDVGFTAASSISHPGPLQFYMAKAPEGQTAATFDGSGKVWFKVYSQGATFSPGGGMAFASSGVNVIPFATPTSPKPLHYHRNHASNPHPSQPGKSQLTISLPASLPSGDYLLRIEHIALHSASSRGGAQFYISCAQLTVQNGSGGGQLPPPDQMVAFPGAYEASDPGILVNIYYPVPTSYTPPGPAVWSG